MHKKKSLFFIKVLFVHCLLFVTISCNQQEIEVPRNVQLGRELRTAIVGDKPEKVKQLLEQGADVNFKENLLYEPPLQVALLMYSVSSRPPVTSSAEIQTKRIVIFMLIDAGANPNTVNDSGATPLMYAAGAGDQDIVQKLFDSGAYLCQMNVRGRTAYDYALDNGHNELANKIELLMDSLPCHK